MKDLSEIGEEALIQRIVSQLNKNNNLAAFRKDLVEWIGDDCAVVDVGNTGSFQLLKTDSIVQGIHYLAQADPKDVGWKAVARVISDFAAMGGYASHLLITIAMSKTTKIDYIDKLYLGMSRCASLYGASISGGETVMVPDGSAAVISVSGTGWVKRHQCVLRSGAKPGDRILVTGLLGGSIKGKHLTFQPRVKEAQWLAERYSIHAMMDLSDGIVRDLPRMAKASGCSFNLQEGSIPCSEGSSVDQALSDGEDYELLLAVSSDVYEELIEKWYKAFPSLPLTAIGSFEAGDSKQALSEAGWQHFSSPS